MLVGGYGSGEGYTLGELDGTIQIIHLMEGVCFIHMSGGVGCGTSCDWGGWCSELY